MGASLLRLAAFVFIGVTGCLGAGPDVGPIVPLVDAGSGDSALNDGGATVQLVACSGTPAMTVIATNAVEAYSPRATTITAGQVVMFVMSSMHDVVPSGASTDPALRVGFGATTCFAFNRIGRFDFECSEHGFKGTITVN